MMSFPYVFPETEKRRREQNLRSPKSRFIFIFTFLLYFLNSFVPLLVEAGESTSVIDTSTGPIRGEVLTTVVKSLKYSSFRSIPFAEQTTGYRRFKPPVPVKPWTEILDATVEPNACPQINITTYEYFGSEDCLFLNIFTPLTEFDKNDDKSKAVMVFIYGGSFVSGYARTDLFGPDFLIEDDVILATFNYRVGALGFMNLYHPEAAGNAGIKDQVLALKWIKENIDKFGGNSEKITIFGTSAGGAFVDFHTVSESSLGLFHGAISMSGSILAPWAFHTREEALNQSFALGSLLGTSTRDKEILLQTLYKATPLELTKATLIMNDISPPFKPTIEDPSIAKNDAFLTEIPLNKYRIGNFTKVPYINGFMAQETAFFFTQKDTQPIPDLVSSAIETIEKINASLPVTNPTLKSLISAASNALMEIPNATLQEYIDYTSRTMIQLPVDLKQRVLEAQSSKPNYYYQVSFNPKKSIHELLYHVVANAAAHGDDTAYLFYTPVIDLPIDEADPISITRRRMVRMWTNFAKYGNPTPDDKADPLLNIIWPNSGISGVMLDIDEELSMKLRPVDSLETYFELFGNIQSQCIAPV